MTPVNPKVTPEIGIWSQVWHRADRDRSGIVRAIVIYEHKPGSYTYGYLVSWGDGEYGEESFGTITDERPTFDGAEDGEN